MKQLSGSHLIALLDPNQFLGRTAMQVAILLPQNRLVAQHLLALSLGVPFLEVLQLGFLVNHNHQHLWPRLPHLVLHRRRLLGIPCLLLELSQIQLLVLHHHHLAVSVRGSSVFGQKPFGGFGSSTTQTSPFGSAFQQSQPVFGSTTFGSSTPFGASTQSAFSAPSTPGFGSSSTSTFGAPTAFGSTGTAFGVSSAAPFGASTPSGFGSTPSGFGSPNNAPFGASSTPFGASSTPFGASSTSPFGASSTSPFGGSMASSTSSFNFAQSTPGFGQTASALAGSSQFGTTTSPFGAQSSLFAKFSVHNCHAGGQATTLTPGNFGQRPGSRVAPYTPTPEQADSSAASGTLGKLESISAMSVYKDKNHEELRWEDYQLGDKGGPNPAAQSTGFGSTNTQANPFASPSPFGQSSVNPFSSSTSSNPFAAKSAPFGSSSTPSFNTPFASTTSPFGSSSLTTPTLFSSTSGFGTSNSSPLFGTSTSTTMFGSSTARGTSSAFNPGFSYNNTQSSPLFQSTVPSIGQTSSGFGQSGLSAFGGTSNFFGQSNPGQSIANQSPAVAQPVSVTNPFGTLPAMPQMSIGRPGTSPSIHYGISSLPVVEKPAPVRVSSFLTSRHLSQRRIRLPARKYHPNNDGAKVPFFSDDEETPTTPKADALFIPWENPRALVIRPLEQWPGRANANKTFPAKDMSTSLHENGELILRFFVDTSKCGNTYGKISEAVSTPPLNESSSEDKDIANGNKPSHKANGVHDDHSTHKGDSDSTDAYISITGHRAGEAAIVFEHGADIEALMPKLRHSDYYTEPRIQEIAAKERAEPGFCRRVKDFVVGRHGYGNIKFLGETDVRRLDLELLIQFNHREVIVYMDDSKKPAVGQGLNKPAEVTLLNIKCVDKKTGNHFTEGPRIDNYKEMLRKKVKDQGAEFVSYDPIKGEWKFRVDHFSKYRLGDEDEDEWNGENGLS
ncbi:hypothetical protein RJ639_043054 [Escallonia herrerae]|uniref:Nucleoporin autopeptidase n=1 Tax=Escallonia herrerae TaxID=1293975 RepID=A0AA89B477_9ASTE|nr:hypothetical protein RJ639_043054 [Escallonia herrerae]